MRYNPRGGFHPSCRAGIRQPLCVKPLYCGLEAMQALLQEELPPATTAVPSRLSLAPAVSWLRVHAHRRSPPAASLVAGATVCPCDLLLQPVPLGNAPTAPYDGRRSCDSMSPKATPPLWARNSSVRGASHSQHVQDEPGALCSPGFPVWKGGPQWSTPASL